MLPDVATSPDSRLPVRAVLAEVVAALAGGGAAVLVAPPGTGKTTLVPLALADALDGRIVVAEPRRVAARAAARRMAALLGERVGDQVGYSVRGERRVGPAPGSRWSPPASWSAGCSGIPSCAGVGAVMLDECHERHLDTDLALAFLVDVRATLRPDLALLAASATADAERLAALPRRGEPVAGDLGRGAAVPGRGRLVAAGTAGPPRLRPAGRPAAARSRRGDRAAGAGRGRRRRPGVPARRRRDRRGRRPAGRRRPTVDVLLAARPADRRQTRTRR